MNSLYFFVSSRRRPIFARWFLACLLPCLALGTELRATVSLSTYSFQISHPPTISTDVWVGSNYQLQAKFLGVPNYPTGFTAALSGNNQGKILDVLPPPGTYDVQLYSIQYTAGSTYNGPINLMSVTVLPDGVWLSSHSFLATQRPLIQTLDAMPMPPDGQYRLRAKLIDGSPLAFHAATSFNNNGKPLDTLPPAGSYPGAFYWVKYDDTGNTVLQVGPEINRQVVISSSQVALTTYWFHQSARAAITSPVVIPPPYRLAAELLTSANEKFEATLSVNNNGYQLDQLPAPNTYTVRLFLKRINADGTVAEDLGTLKTETVTITSGAVPLVNAAGHLTAQDNTDEEGYFTGTDIATDFYAVEVRAPGLMTVNLSGASVYTYVLNHTWTNVADAANGSSVTVNVVPGIYRFFVSGDSGGMSAADWPGADYLLSASLALTTPPPAIDAGTGAAPSAQLGVPYSYQIVASPTPTTYYAAAGSLPPGLTLNQTTGVISGTPTTFGRYFPVLWAANAGGAGPSVSPTMDVAKATPVLTVKNELVDNQTLLPITQAMIPVNAVAPASGLPAPTGTIRYTSYRVDYPNQTFSPLLPTPNSLLYYGLDQSFGPLSVTATYDGDANYLPATKTVFFENRDKTAPTFTDGTGLAQLLVAPNSASVRWNAATDPRGVTYEVSIDNGATVYASGLTKPETVFKNLAAGLTYQVVVRARDSRNNATVWSAPLPVTPPAAAPVAAATTRWQDVDGDGLLDEIIPQNTATFTAFTLPEADRELTMSEWIESFTFVPGFYYVETVTYTATWRTFGFNGSEHKVTANFEVPVEVYVPPAFVPEMTESIQTIRLAQVSPVFQFFAEPGNEYSINREITFNDSIHHKVYPPLVARTVWEALGLTGSVHEVPFGVMLESSYDAFPTVLVRYSKPPVGSILTLPGIGAVTANKTNGTITLANGTKITAGPTGATVTIPGVGNVMIGTDGSVTSSPGGTTLPSGVTHTTGVPSIGLPGGITVNPGTGEVTIAGPAGSSVTVGGTGGLRVALPPGLASIAGIIGKAVDALGTILGGGTDPTKTKVDNGDGIWRDLDDPALVATPGTQNVRVGVTDNDSRAPKPQNIFTITFTINPPVVPRPKILLLLHGMNSNTATWNQYVRDVFTYSGSDGVIHNGVLPPEPAADSRSVRCYRLQFGIYDVVQGRVGLEGVTVRNPLTTPCGDFEDFNSLGAEVYEAIELLLSRHQNAQIVLVGHSRGGVSARAFLQSPSPAYGAAKLAVVGLLTTGSPHLGSPLAWIYQWLGEPANRRPTPINEDWKVVDWLRDTTALGPFVPKAPLDLRRPVIGQLQDGGPELGALNSLLANLPTHIRYGEIAYHDCPLGVLQLGYSVFDGKTAVVSELSSGATAYLLKTDGSSSANSNAKIFFRGDGLVPFGNQRFTQLLANLPQFSGALIVPKTVGGGLIVHTDEPTREADLTSQLKVLVDWWK